MRRLVATLTAVTRLAVTCLAITCVAASVSPPAAAQTAGARRAREPVASSAGQPDQPPHAWLFGTWTGGLFPVPTGISTEACLSQPVVIFTRDVVLRATITDQFYTQRLIETALTSSGGTQFRFTSALPPVAVNGLLRSQSVAPPGVGFGCDSPDTLAVERRGENQIAFPGCADFPYPLVRCH